MDYKELSKWFWDIAKYVVTAIIITSFLGNFQDDALLLYGIGLSLVVVFLVTGAIFQKKSKRKKP